jgi:hypothetical protein
VSIRPVKGESKGKWDRESGRKNGLAAIVEKIFNFVISDF